MSETPKERAARALRERRGVPAREHRECGNACVYVADADAAVAALVDVDEIAGVLARHQFASIYNSRTNTAECICGDDLPISGGFDRDGYSYDPQAVEVAFCAHQAAEVARHLGKP